MTTQIRLPYGQPDLVPNGATAAWGARMIVTQDGYVDLVYDRQGAGGEDAHAFVAKLNDGRIKAIKDRISELLRSYEMKTREPGDFVVYAQDGVECHANTNGSAGYCYVTAWAV